MPPVVAEEAAAPPVAIDGAAGPPVVANEAAASRTRRRRRDRRKAFSTLQGLEAVPEPAPVREPTESAPEPAPVREPTESAGPSTWLVVCCWCHVLCKMCSPHFKVCPLPSCYLIIFSVAPPVSLVTFLVCLPIYSPGVCSPVLIHCCMSCVLCLPTLQRSACLFFPRWVVFVHLFNLGL